MIIATQPYDERELGAILAIRAEEEDVAVTPDALALLTKIAKETSLRYAMHMIMAAALTAKQRRASEVDVPDVRKVFGLFSDLRRSTQFLLEYNSSFMFNELVTAAAPAPSAAAAAAAAGGAAGGGAGAAMDTS
jgi:DNA helicase TIP49 (TBP-interacting protein)